MASRVRKTLTRLLAAGVAAALLCAALIWWGSGPALRYAAGIAAERAGFRVAALERVELSWRAGAVAIAGVELAQAGQPPLRLGAIDLRVDWRALLAGRLQLPVVALRGVSLELERRKDGTFVLSGLALGGNASGEKAVWSWPVGVAGAQISDATLVYRDGATRTALKVATLVLERFDFDDPKRALRFDMAASLDGSPFALSGVAQAWDAAPSFRGRFETTGFDLAGVAALAKRELAGRLDAAFEIAIADKAGIVDASLAGHVAVTNLAAPDIEADAIEWNGRALWNGKTGLAVTGAGALEKFATTIMGETKIAVGKLDLTGLELARTPAGETRLSGALEGRALEIAAPELAVSLGTVAANGVLSVASEALHYEGSVALDTAKLANADIAASLARASFRGRVERDGAGLRSAGTLALERGEGASKKAQLAASLGTLRHEGAAIATPAPAVSGRLTGSEIAIDTADGRQLAAIGSFEASGLVADADGTQAPRIDFGNLRVLRRVRASADQPAFPWRIEAPLAVVRDLKLDGMRALAASDVRIERPTLRLTRIDGGWLSLDRSPPQGDAPAVLRFAVGRLALSGGRAMFEDRTPETPVRLALDNIEIGANDIDNARPERPIAFSLGARVGRFGSVTAQGTAFAFAPKLSFDLELEAKAIDLPPLSPYVDAALGVDLRVGLGDVSVRLAGRDEILAGTTNWRLSNLRLDDRETASDAVPKYPLATALSLLADADGNVALAIPIAGPLGDPQFDTADAVRQAVGGALESALSTALSVLFPFGAIVSNGLDAEKRGTSIVLPPVAFAPGKSDLDALAEANMVALASVLEARPGARVEACGFAVPGEIDKGSADDLLALAQARASAVKQRLADGGKIAAGRIFECRAILDELPGAIPRVETKFQ